MLLLAPTAFADAPPAGYTITADQWALPRSGAALIRLPDGSFGIVTDRDLRDRVIADGVGSDAPVSEVMSSPAFRVIPLAESVFVT